MLWSDCRPIQFSMREMFLCHSYFFALISVVLGSLSGLYVDNGIDQTVIQRVMTLKEKQEIQEEILNLLGLPERPNVQKTSQPTVSSSAPKFLLDVYKSLLNSPSARTTRSEFNLSDKELQSIDESDIIISFSSHRKFFICIIFFFVINDFCKFLISFIS